MTWTPLLTGLPVAAAIGYTVRLLNILRRPSPPAGPEADAVARSSRRNAWIDDVYHLLCVGAFALPLILFKQDVDRVGLPAVGLAFGGAAVIPWLWVCVVTLPSGRARYNEFWAYYSHRYRISLKTLAIASGLLALVGLVSIAALAL